MTKAIGKHLRDFVAVIALAILALVATGIVLVNQQATLPNWVPLLGSDRFELKAAFTTAQAVTPGQGQTVNIAGIKVGSISSVDLVNGDAVVTMEVENKYAPLIHPDASLLLRPRTGLADMTIELDPGTGHKEVAEGSTIPLAQTQPNVQPDQFLASLDADTRGFLQLLLQGGARGIGNGVKFSAVLRRFDPTARDLAKINGLLAKRRQNIKRSIHNFGLVSQELATHDRELQNFVTSSNSVFADFANQQQSLREIFQELPSTLQATRGALQSSNRFSLALAPALRKSIPSARALGPALHQTQPFFRDTRAPIKNQIRPFTRQVFTPVKHLKQASGPLGDTSTTLARALGDANLLFNELTYNPPGGEEGFLFWASWLSHNVNASSFIQDANGSPIRGYTMLSCVTAGLAEAVGTVSDFVKTLLEINNIPTQLAITGAGGCAF
jgi:phospholipid/cholesterol/gamma-HCH transport system substrate-binding protein